jgi:hypothetical protein
MRVVVIALTVAALCLTTTGLALAGDAGGPRHVRQLSGTRVHGFHVVWSDGYDWWTPALSEELAMCHEYDRAVRRGRCKAAARTEFHWMGIVKRSLRHR